jgi:hypothetical protein
MTSNLWLFSFTSYTYCQGTRDRGFSYKLVKSSLPIEQWEAKKRLIDWFVGRDEEIDKESIKSETIFQM